MFCSTNHLASVAHLPNSRTNVVVIVVYVAPSMPCYRLITCAVSNRHREHRGRQSSHSGRNQQQCANRRSGQPFFPCVPRGSGASSCGRSGLGGLVLPPQPSDPPLWLMPFPLGTSVCVHHLTAQCVRFDSFHCVNRPCTKGHSGNFSLSKQQSPGTCAAISQQ